jgi:hypothetical protein
MYSVFLAACCASEVILIISQLLADRYGKHKIQDNVARILLYGVYISALMCSSFGFSLHESKHHPLWCEFYGVPPCFGVLGSTKAFLYGFFLRRARKAHANNIQTTKIWFDVIGPAYIFIYWVIYVVLTSIFFTGKPVNATSENEVISWCLFNNWKWWFVILANTVDLLNCIVTLFLFLYPLLKSVNRLKTNDNSNNTLLLKFIDAMRWNVCLSFVATISSIVTLVSIPFVKEYIWLFCAGDPCVNSICVFFMMATNRTFLKDRLCKTCQTCQNSDESEKNDGSSKGSNAYDMNPISPAAVSSPSITSAVVPSIMIETGFATGTNTKSVKKQCTFAASFVQSKSNQTKKNKPLIHVLILQKSASY